MKRLTLILMFLLISLIYLYAQEELPSYKGIQIDDDVQKVYDEMGELLKEKSYGEGMKSIAYDKNGDIVIFVTRNNKVEAFIVVFADAIPQKELKLEERGFKSSFDEFGTQQWSKYYAFAAGKILEAYESKPGSDGLIKTRFVKKLEEKK
jgi:hypothetical protein